MHGHVVGRVEPLAVVAVAYYRDAAVIFSAAHAPRAMLATDEPAPAVAAIAVRIIRWLAKDAHPAARLFPFHDPVVGNIAPQQIAAVAEPDRPLAPAHAGCKPLEPGAENLQPLAF